MPNVMVDVSAVALAESLIERKASYREIRRQTGLASSTISRILRGEITAKDRAGERLETFIATRCTGCGGMQYQPCQVCSARARKEARRFEHDAA